MLEGEGAERNYGPDITTYRCPNGYEWHNGQWPYLENECLNRKWSHKTLPPCKSEESLLVISVTNFDYFQREGAVWRYRNPGRGWT